MYPYRPMYIDVAKPSVFVFDDLALTTSESQDPYYLDPNHVVVHLFFFEAHMNVKHVM